MIFLGPGPNVHTDFPSLWHSNGSHARRPYIERLQLVMKEDAELSCF